MGQVSERPANDLPTVDYPEGAVDVSQLIIDERLYWDEPETRGKLSRALEQIERGQTLILHRASLDYEELRTAHGSVRLHGITMSWWLRDKEVSLATLWERFPELRGYLRSRTEFLIRIREAEIDQGVISGEADLKSHQTDIERLHRELELLPED